MCRFVAYFGKEKLLLHELLAKPENSLIKQSREAIEGVYGINADGFGVAWYDFNIDEEPGVFKSIQPAWNDSNLLYLSKKIRSSCFLAHVRASTIGDVSQSNCHPFVFEQYAMVHNGTIRNFEYIRRALLAELDDELFSSVKGNTDSECLFFLIMHFVRQGNSLKNAVKKAISWIVDVQSSLDEESFSRINLVVTNGKEIIGTRFVSKNQASLCLRYKTQLADNAATAFMLSSEPLDNSDSLWLNVPENSSIHIESHSRDLIIEKIL